MPKISLNKERVLELVGKKVSDKELNEKIPYIGTDLESVGDEIEVEIFPNRPDLLSLEGFSRALSSFLGINKGLKKYTAQKSNYVVEVNSNLKEIRPYTVCAVVKNLKLNELILDDIIEMQEKLHITHGRNRKKCAIGIYPLNKISFPVKYLAQEPDKIRFIPLGFKEPVTGREIIEKHEKGKAYKHLMKDKYPVFIDSKGEYLSMPPIINSQVTGNVTTNTKDVFIECSGTSFETISQALNIVVTSLIDIGGEAFEVKVKYKEKTKITPEFKNKTININYENVKKLLGINISNKEIIESLHRMGFGVEKNKIIIPVYRTDILHEVDIIEDIAIGYGYYNIKGDTEKVFTTGKQEFLELFKSKIRESLIGVGFIENVSYNIVNFEKQNKFFKNILKIKNSSNLEYNSMRKSLLVSLMNNLEVNKRNGYPQQIFELGLSFEKNKEIIEQEKLSVVIAGEETDYTKIKSYFDHLEKSLGITFDYKKEYEKPFIEGRCTAVYLKNKKIGFIGELHPEFIKTYNLYVPISAVEISIEELSKMFN